MMMPEKNGGGGINGSGGKSAKKRIPKTCAAKKDPGERFSFTHLLPRILAVSAVSVVLAVVLSRAGLFAALENVVYDDRMRRTAFTARPSEDITVVLLDQESLEWGSSVCGWSWPWPRAVYGDIVDFFRRGGASAVAFDVLFTEPSVYGTGDDEAFAEACRQYGRVVQTVFFSEAQGTYSGWNENAPLPPGAAGLNPGSSPVLFPVDHIARSADLLGSINSVLDADGTVRRAAAYYMYGEYAVPTLAVAQLYAAGADAPDLETEPEEGRLLRFQNDITAYVPYNAKQILESYYAVRSGREPVLDPSLFEGSYVFFGFFAPGLFDICATPVSQNYPGVGVHITQLDNCLQDAFLEDIPGYVSFLLIVACALLGSVPFTLFQTASRRTAAVAPVVLFALSVCLYVVAAYVAFAAGFVSPVVPPVFALFCGFLSSSLVSYFSEGKKRRYLKQAFRQYLSPAVIDELVADPGRLKLGGERRRISIYFSDVQGFTSISEKLQPEELTALLNDYLSAMTDIILDSGGTIDKYEGDAVIAFWNAPTEQGDHARRALEAAVACQKKLDQMRPELEARAGRPFYMRIGLNTGNAVVGNMGSRSRFDYTMLGDSVNLAARLEGLNKQFGTYCMCTEASKNEAQEFGTELCFRELARAAVVGKKEAVTVYEPMPPEEYARRRETLSRFSEALSLFYSGKMAEALAAFEGIAGEDAAAKHYVGKCQALRASWGGADTAPAGWGGVWVADSK